ncbi:DUF1828 domain-containing protein [Microcoleus sp. N9_B2]|uniref:DUF1828 domain-containing protein n=1 Tax=unclassified Microcoleus TaxID=2642155 RepID=UPI002FCF1E09
MTTDAIEREFKQKVCEELRLAEEGKDRFRIFTPFRFDDGDHLAIVLKREKNQWLLSDEGHTYMHLTYRFNESDLESGTRKEIIENSLAEFQVENRYGEFIVKIEQGEYGDALYRFAQALLRISNVSYLSRERVKSTFYEDFRTLIAENVPEDRYVFEWHDTQHDPEGFYKVDCHINNMATPLCIYALPNDNQVRDATISLFQFEKWENSFYPIAIFQDADKVSNKVLKKFSKVCDKQFPSLQENRLEIANYLREVLSL